MEYIHRAIEIELEDTFRTFKCALVTGARQTGKFTTLQNLFPACRYVALSDDFLMEQANENSRFLWR